MKPLLIAILLLLVTPVWAQEQLKVQCYKLDEGKCSKLVARLSEELPKFPIRGWTWVLLDKTGWKEFQKKSGATTKTAATLTSDRITFVNAEWFLSASFREYLSVIAHEYGHFTCKTKSESEADICGERLLYQAGYSWSVTEYLASLR